MKKQKPCCGAEHHLGFSVCSRPKGHRGNHKEMVWHIEPVSLLHPLGLTSREYYVKEWKRCRSH